MALGIEIIHLLRDLKSRGVLPEDRSVVEIGAQQLASSLLNAREELGQLAMQYGVPTAFPLPPAARGDASAGTLQALPADAPPASRFWEWLGYRYACIDLDGYASSIPLDLNFDSVPPGERKRHALVTNFGTTEHVANQVNAFKVIHDLTAPQGLMLHWLPAQGMFNHGLVNYNPKFFWMLARSNGYGVVAFDIGADSVRHGLPQNIMEFTATYAPTVRDRLADLEVRDAHIMAIFRKGFDIPYVPPIDLATGSATDNEDMRQRYWTVFTPDAFMSERATRPQQTLLSRLAAWPLARRCSILLRRMADFLDRH
jgi:hypothetical protein